MLQKKAECTRADVIRSIQLLSTCDLSHLNVLNLLRVSCATKITKQNKTEYVSADIIRTIQ